MRITRRGSRHRRKQSLQLLIRQLLSLITHQIINRKPASRTPATGHKLNRTPTRTTTLTLKRGTIRMMQHNSLLTIRRTNRLHHTIQVRKLPLILKKRPQPHKRLTSRLQLVSRMQNTATLNSRLKQLHNLKDSILAILARHKHPTHTRSKPAITTHSKPIIQHLLLPRIRRQPIRTTQLPSITASRHRIRRSHTVTRNLRPNNTRHLIRPPCASYTGQSSPPQNPHHGHQTPHQPNTDPTCP